MAAINLTKDNFFNSMKKGEWKTFIDSVLDAGLNINTKIFGYTLLSFAAEYGDREIAEYLVQKGADSNATNCDGTKPLHIAAQYSHLKVVEFFINLGVCVDSRDNNNRTPLLHIAERFHVQVVNPEIWDKDRKMWSRAFHHAPTPLFCYASEVHMDLGHFLLASGADCNAIDNRGNVALLLAAKNFCVRVVKMLIMWGANVDCCDDNKWTVLHYASFAGWLDIVQSLVDKGIDVNAETSGGDTALLFAVIDSNKEVIELLIKSGANIEKGDVFDWTLLHHACKKGWLSVVRCIADKGGDVNAKAITGATPLMVAIQYSYRSIFDLLVKSGARLDCRDENETTVLHYACRTGWIDVVQSLMEKGYDINAKDTGDNTPLLLAAKHSHREIFDMLFKSGARPHVCKWTRWSFLHHVCKEGWLDYVQPLLKKGSGINAKTLEGKTPLYMAASFSRIDVLECLMDAGADVNVKIPLACGERANDGSFSGARNRIDKWTVLQHASFEGWLEVVVSLIGKGIDINVKTLEGDTLLHLALKGDNVEIVEHLLRAEANCNIKNERGETALACLVLYGLPCAKAIALLLENGSYILQHDFKILSSHAFFKEDILQNVNLCTQTIINEFNNFHLEKVYTKPFAVEYLPRIEKMKIKGNGTVAHSIEQSVRHEIEEKGYCNLVEVRPIVLSLLTVRYLINHFI